MRRLPDIYPNGTEEEVKWERLDPNHIAGSARQLEVYHLKVNNHNDVIKLMPFNKIQW